MGYKGYRPAGSWDSYLYARADESMGGDWRDPDCELDYVITDEYKDEICIGDTVCDDGVYDLVTDEIKSDRLGVVTKAYTLVWSGGDYEDSEEEQHVEILWEDGLITTETNVYLAYKKGDLAL